MLWKVGGHRNNIAHVASTMYICSNLWCYGISALYHVGNWSVQTEILLQKLDHCGVAILSTGTMIPCCLLLLPMHIGLLFMSLSIMCSVRTCYYVLRLEPSVSRQVSQSFTAIGGACTPMEVIDVQYLKLFSSPFLDNCSLCYAAFSSMDVLQNELL